MNDKVEPDFYGNDAEEYGCSFYTEYDKNLFRDKVRKVLALEFRAKTEAWRDGRKKMRIMAEMSDNFDNMRKDGHFSDAVIKCGEKSFKVHKNVLCARSPVFAAIFLTPMQESQENMVVIEDIEPATFDKLLQFVYSGQFENMDLEMAIKLLGAAEKYQIGGLRSLCIFHIKSKINIENCLDVLRCGITYDSDLKEFALAYIAKEYVVFRKTDTWLSLQKTNPPLAFEICTYICDLLFGK